MLKTNKNFMLFLINIWVHEMFLLVTSNGNHYEIRQGGARGLVLVRADQSARLSRPARRGGVDGTYPPRSGRVGLVRVELVRVGSRRVVSVN